MNTTDKDHAQVHRFQNKVAIYLPNGETAYLTTEDAVRVYIAISECIESIWKQPDFSKSTFATQVIPLQSIDKN